jgi:HAD superfamily hydrolase (TIGR01509 family)
MESLSGVSAVFLDFGGTLMHNNITFPQGVCLALNAAGVHVSSGMVKAAVWSTDVEMRAEHIAAQEPSAYEACRLRYYMRVQELLGLSPSPNLASYLHRVIGMYHGAMLNPEVPYALTRLRESGFLLGMVSNFSHALPGILRKLGIYDFFRFVTYSDNVGAEKPDALIFADALHRAGISPDHVIHVGDSYEADVLGARSAGITPVWLVNDPPLNPDCLWAGNMLGVLDLLGLEHIYRPPVFS